MARALRSVRLPRWIDPATAFAAVVGESDGFWLDAGPDADDGWSWIGRGVREEELARVRSTPLPDGAATGPGPGPFTGGWVGWISYETGAATAGAPVSPGDPAPVERWLRTGRMLAWDHARQEVWALGPDDGVADWARELALLSGEAAPPPGTGPERVARARIEPERYAALVESCRASIRAGDAYQLCLTNRFTVEGAPVDVLDTYLRLRALAPSHHGGLVRAGGTTLLSASPERFLEARHGRVQTRPIKGTRPRHPDPGIDGRLADELRRSPKERAENVMIVDLMRNDLSRIGVPGGIRVDALLEVESYRSVHQLVSSVSAEVRRGTSVGDLLTASFPAGSMTGAPKLSAMTILHRLEDGPRGVFSGCFGYVGDDGAVDLAMVIRSIVAHAGGAYVGAGGGITWHSVPQEEVREVGWKARAPLQALGAALPPGWAM